MLKQLDPWMWRFVVVVAVGALTTIVAIVVNIDPLLHLGRIIMTTGGGAFYACYLSEKFFGTHGAKMLQGVFLAALLFLVLVSAARLFGGTIATDLIVVQLIGYMGLSMLYSVSIVGFAGLMASNYMRVPSGRNKGIREIASGVAAALMMYSGFIELSPELLALVCALVVVLLAIL